MKTKTLIPCLSILAITLLGCGGPLAGTWNGTLAPSSEFTNKKRTGYSETKPSLTSTIELSGGGDYTAKLQEVDYTGTWKSEGQKLILTPTTYMGLDQAHFGTVKKGAADANTVSELFKPYELEVSADNKTMTHTDKFGTTTYAKAD